MRNIEEIATVDRAQGSQHSMMRCLEAVSSRWRQGRPYVESIDVTDLVPTAAGPLFWLRSNVLRTLLPARSGMCRLLTLSSSEHVQSIGITVV